MGVSIVVMLAVAVGVVLLFAGRDLARSSVKAWQVPADQRAWREDQLAGTYHLAGALTFVALFLYGVSYL